MMRKYLKHYFTEFIIYTAVVFTGVAAAVRFIYFLSPAALPSWYKKNTVGWLKSNIGWLFSNMTSLFAFRLRWLQLCWAEHFILV